MTIGQTLLMFLPFFVLAPMTTSFYLSPTRSIVRQDVTTLLTNDDFPIPIAMISHIRSIPVIRQSIRTSEAQQYTMNDQKNQILGNGRTTFMNMLKKIRNRLNRVYYVLFVFIWLSLFLRPTQPVTAAVTTTADTITTTTIYTINDNDSDHSSLTARLEQQQYGQLHRKNDSSKKNRLKLRLITGSALIFVTGVVRTKKIRERKESNSTDDNNATDNGIVLPVASKDKESVNRPNLNWLIPQTNRDNNNDDKVLELSTTAATATNSESKFISIRNKFNESTKIVERLAQQTSNSSNNTMKPNSTNNNNNNKISNGVTKNETKRVNNRLKSVQEEEELQAKYASIESLEERAYTILVDLGMVGPSAATDPLDSTWE